MNELKLKCSVEDLSISQLQDISDSQFMKGRVKAFADGLNRNNILFTLEGIKKAEKTILGKPVLAAFTMWNSDGLGGHDKEEFPVGYVPEDATITYEESEDGRTFLCTDFYLWKHYTNNLEEILNESNGFKEVSVELVAIDPTEDKEQGITIVDDFVFCGITILSKDLNPAVKDASLQVLKFSEEEFNRDKDAFDRLRESLKINNSAIEEPNKSSFLMQKNNKEETMAEVNNEKPVEEVVLNSAEEQEKEVIVNAEETPSEEVENACGKKEDNACGDKVDNACGDVKNAECGEQVDNSSEEEKCEEVDNALKVKCSELEEKNSTLKVKCSEYESKITDLESKIKELTVKCSTLEEFKVNTENAKKVQEIECALAEVADTLTVEEIADWRQKSVNCSSVDGFKNELKAYAFDLQKTRGSLKTEETLRNAIPVNNNQEDESLDIWDRLAKTL